MPVGRCTGRRLTVCMYRGAAGACHNGTRPFRFIRSAKTYEARPATATGRAPRRDAGAVRPERARAARARGTVRPVAGSALPIHGE